MKHPLRLLFSIPAITLAIAVGVSAQGKEEQSVIPVTTVVAPAVTTTTPPITVVPVVTTTVVTLPAPTLPVDVPCQEWTQTALDAGWHWELLPEILTIAHRESRCQNIIEGHPKWNGHDSGPLQINQVWHDEIEAKYGHSEYVNIPYYNFAWAWEMYIWFDANRGCGFDPWYKTYSCK